MLKELLHKVEGSKYFHSSLRSTIGLAAFLAACTPTPPHYSTDPYTIDFEQDVDQNGFLTAVRASFIPNPNYCQNPAAQKTSDILEIADANNNTALGIALETSCRPTPQVLAERILVISNTSGKSTNSELINIALKYGDNILATIQKASNQNWSIVVVDGDNDTQAQVNTPRAGSRFVKVVELTPASP